MEATTKTTISGDGLTSTLAVDRNGDDRLDRIVTDATVLSEDGAVERTVDHRDGRNISLGKEIHKTSDDGLSSTIELDLDGDGLFDYTTESSTEFDANGDVVTRQITLDETFSTQSDIRATTTGDGLETKTQADYSGDGSIDRLTTVRIGADGSVTETVSEFGTGIQLLRSHQRNVSADGLTETVRSDRDGDGFEERETITVVDANRTTTTTIRSFAQDSSLEGEVVQTSSANGLHRVLEVDVDGDGDADIVRTADVAYDTQGNRIATYTETGVDGQVTYQEVKTTSADGLTVSSNFDLDGDGNSDGTTQFETALHDDGSQTTTSQTQYADGELRSLDRTTTSRDGRSVSRIEDFDGNGIADRVTEVEVHSDGERVVTERAFNEAGYETNTFITTTSADGLTQTILRNGNEQTITRSSLDNGSYTWDNGVAADVGQTHVVATHEVDALGVETWTLVKAWKDANGNAQSEVTTTRLDQVAKARVFEEAARIYDAILDRDADFIEFEVLVNHIQNGELEKGELVSSLINSGEFTTRYGTLSDAEFITQIYLNAYGRAPSLGELSDDLGALDDGTVSRVDLAVRVSESAEHVMVGNGHRSTNNFDVVLNPAQFERSLDKAHIANLVKSLVDVVYDREATEYELEYLSDLLLESADNPDDIATKLLAANGGMQGEASNSLFGLSGVEFVKQAFLNAFGRLPTPEELQTWSENLDNGQLTKAQFVASLAQSIEHKSVGTAHISTTVEPIVTVDGTNAGETVAGSDGQDDRLNGLEGNDTLRGGRGNSDQRLRWIA